MSGQKFGNFANPATDTNVEEKLALTGAELLVGYDATGDKWIRAPASSIAALAGIGGGVLSFKARTGAVSPALGDYLSSLITNDSGVAGSSVKDALDQLAADIAGAPTDHGGLLGLDDDDHPQYLTASRGDARYYNVTAANLLLAGKSDVGHDHDADYAAIAHVGDTANPHSVTKAQVGLDQVANIKNNFAATVAPDATDDSTAGYAVGSIWCDVNADKAYICLDASAAGAVWTETTAAAAAGVTDHGVLDGLGDDDHAHYHTDARGDLRYFTQAQVAAWAPGWVSATGKGFLPAATGADNLTALDAVYTDALATGKGVFIEGGEYELTDTLRRR